MAEIRKIFYIEKEPFIRKMFELALEDEDAEVYTTGDIEDCLHHVKEMGSQIIIIDVETLLPVKEKFLAEMKGTDYCADIPVVAIGFPTKLAMVKGEEWYTGTIQKPVSVRNLLQTIQESIK